MCWLEIIVVLWSWFVILGPWAKNFLQPLGLELPLRPVRVESLYWEIDAVPGSANSGVCIIGFEEDDGCYIVPEYEYPGMIKVIIMYLLH